MSYFISISFVLVVIYLLFKNRQYTLYFDTIVIKIFCYEILAIFIVSLISYFVESPLAAFISPESVFYLLIENTLLVAPLEEISKFIAVYLGTNRLKNLRQKEDFLLYFIFSACIFSGVENLLYIFIYDNDVLLALLRNFVSTPCHLFYSTIFGFFYTLKLQLGTYRTTYFLQGLFFSSFFHGFINFCLGYYSYTPSLLGILFSLISLCFFYIVGFHIIKKHMKKSLLIQMGFHIQEDDINTQRYIYYTWILITIFLLILILK